MVFFYKQHTTEFNILQIEHEKLDQLADILTEHKPTVIRGLGEPKLLTPEALRQNARLSKVALSPSTTVAQFLDKPQLRLTPPVELRKAFAQESGLHVWAEHMWFPKLTEGSPWSFCMSLDSEVFFGSLGMTKTVAPYTVFYPTSGEFICSIVADTSLKFLPATWPGRYISEMTAADCPLLHEIQYMDIVLRPGHMLIMPAHWIVSLKAVDGKGAPIFAALEVHHPISTLAKALA